MYFLKRQFCLRFGVSIIVHIARPQHMLIGDGAVDEVAVLLQQLDFKNRPLLPTCIW